MEGFPSIKGAKIDASLVRKLKNSFKGWSMFSVGKTKTHVTPSGGIHFSGAPTLTNSISFEIKRGGTYLMISLFEYPKGLVFHAHVYYPDIERKSKDDWKKTISLIYEEIKKISEEK